MSATGSRTWANAVARAQPTGGPNAQRHALADAQARPITFFLTAGQTLDAIGAWALVVEGERLRGRFWTPSARGLLDFLPKPEAPLTHHSADADCFRKT